MQNDCRKLLRCLLAILLAGAALPLMGEEAGIYFSTESGLLHGKTLELVYFGPNEYGIAEDYRVSRLDWPLGPTPYWGSRVELRGSGGLRAEVGLRAALPGLRGAMEDYDYLNWDGAITHYSRHENHIERALFAEAEVGWALPTRGRVHFHLGAGLEAMSFKWTAREGYLQYEDDPSTPTLPDEQYVEWSENTPKVEVYGTGIGYEQLWLLPRLSFSATAPLGSIWVLQAGIAAFPFAICRDLDNHLARTPPVDYIEIMGGGIWLKPELSLERKIDSRASLQLQASSHLAWGLVGDAYERSTATGTSFRYKNGGGTELWDLQLGLGYRLKL